MTWHERGCFAFTLVLAVVTTKAFLLPWWSAAILGGCMGALGAAVYARWSER